MSKMITRIFLMGSILTMKFAVASELRVQINDNGKSPFHQSTHGFAHITFYEAVLGKLLNVTEAHTIEPNLLEVATWDYTSEAYILKIQPKLHFHNGRAVTAKDLEYSLIRYFLAKGRADPVAFLRNIIGIDSVKAGDKFETGMVPGIEIIDNLTVSVKLSAPNPSFLFLLGEGWLSLVPMEELQNDHLSWKKHPVGAGPYLVLETSSSSTIIKATSNNLRPVKIIFDSLPQKLKRENSLEAVAFSQHNPDPKNLSAFNTNQALGYSGIFFNFKNQIAKDSDFRKVLFASINRERLTKSDNSISPLYQFLTSNFFGRLSDLGPPPKWSDSNLVKKVRKKYKGRTIVFSTHQDDNFLSEHENFVIDHIKEILTKVMGFKVKCVNSDSIAFTEKDQEVAIRFGHRGTAFLDPLIIFNAFNGNGLLSSYFPDNDPTYERLLAHATQAISTDIKHQSINKITKHIFDRILLIPLYERKKIIYADKKIITSIGSQPGIGIDFSKFRFK